MARGVMRWVAPALLACVAIGVAYLPPRGGVRTPDPFRMQVPQPTPARLRAQALAEQWGAAAAAVRLAEHRRRMTPLLARLSSAAPGPSVLLEGPDSTRATAREFVAATLDSAWRHLGLGASKVAVGVVVELSDRRARTASAATPSREGGSPAYLLPDSTDRTACIVLIPAPLYWTRVITGEQAPGVPRERLARQVEAWLKASLGPCAFYAAFGSPGKPVRRWLGRRNFDLALFPNWIADSAGTSADRAAWFMFDPGTRRWWWDWVYQQSFSAVECLAQRAGGCRAAVLEGTGSDLEDSVSRLVIPNRRWWRQQRLIVGERYLADVAREVGRDRFLRFWNSPLPVDTALAAALKAPVGEWSARWQRRFSPRLPLGAAASVGASLLGLLLAAGALACVTLAATRRQVR